jgi:hypothetical protein
MKDINDIFKIGDTVIAGGQWINPLLEYSDQLKQAQEPLPIDVSWEPPPMYVSHPDTKNTKVFLRKGDLLTILSKAIEPPRDCRSYIFRVQDKDGNQYYLSCEWFEEYHGQ